jgi:hypothetical protein
LVPPIIFVAVRDALARFFSARFQRLPILIHNAYIGLMLYINLS